MSRRSRIINVLLIALVAGAVGVYLLLKRSDTADGPPEARRNRFLSLIAFTTERHAPQEARRRAEAAYEQIRSGTPFEEVARAQSEDDGSRMMGGFLGLVEVHMEQMTAFHGAAQMLEEGQLSRPVYDGRAYILLYRHPYEEGRKLEHRWFLPYYGFRVAWRDLPGGPDRSRDQARGQANSAVEDLRAGRITIGDARARFGEPDDTPANGWLDLLRLRPDSETAYRVLAAVPEGGVADPLESERGFMIMRRGYFFRSVVRNMLVRHIESDSRPPQEIKLRPEAEAKARAALARVLADPTRWDDVVRATTDELFGVDDRGYIGCLAPGSLPPTMAALEAAILATPPGKIHPNVVETPVGFHIVWRVD